MARNIIKACILFLVARYEVLLGLMIGWASYQWLSDNTVASIGGKLMEPVINVAAIGMGYLGALLAILYATPHEKLKRLQTSSIGIDWLQATAKASIVYCFFVALASCALLVIDFKSLSCCKRVILCAWIALVLSTVICVSKLSKLVFGLISLKKLE